MPFRTSLFDNFERSDTGPKPPGVSDYDYLNKTARISFRRIRWILDRWLSHYPEEFRGEIIGRMRSGDNSEYRAMFFELYMYTLWMAHGYEVEIHPEAPGANGKHPDFCLSRKGEVVAYVECTTTSERAEKIRRDKLVQELEKQLNKIDNPDFFVMSEVEEYGERAPKARSIALEVTAWIDGLEWEKVAESRLEGLSNIPALEVSRGDWSLRFSAVPKKDTARGKVRDKSSTPVNSFAAHWSTVSRDLIRSVGKKATRYGEFGMPYIVAINLLDPMADQDDVEIAMFGSEAVSVDRDTGEIRSSFRDTDGVYLGPNGPKNTRVSGILVACGLAPHFMSKITPVMWHNPWAAYELSAQGWKGPGRRMELTRTPAGVVSGKLVRNKGLRGCEMLKIPKRLLDEPGRRDDGGEGIWRSVGS